MENNTNRNLEFANYIWEILKTRIEIIMSWDIDPGKARVIKNGMELLGIEVPERM